MKTKYEIQKEKYLKYINDKINNEKNAVSDVKKFKNKIRNQRYNKKQGIKLATDQRRLKNRSELIFRSLLIKFNIKHTWQKPFSCRKRWVCVDFYLNDFNVVVEIDGATHLKNVEYDRKRTKYLIEHHNVKEVLRINNSQLRTNINNVIEFVIAKFA